MIRYRVLVEGRDLACSGLSGTIGWGRDDTDSQPESSTCSITFADPGGAIAGSVEVGERIDVFASMPRADVQRFGGTIVDVVHTVDSRTTTLTGAGELARLARFRVGDEPWPAELDGDRILRILLLAGVRLDTAGSWAEQDPAIMWRWSPDSWQAIGHTGAAGPWASTPGVWADAGDLDDSTYPDAGPLGSWRDQRGPSIPAGELTIAERDVDRQPVTTLLREVAASALGVMYERRDGTLAYAPRDARTREVDVFADACTFTTEATFKRTSAGVVNELETQYGPSSARGSFIVRNDGSLSTVGRYSARWDTDLALEGEARLLAELHVARRTVPGWNLDALTFDSLVGGDLAAANLMRVELGDTLLLVGAPTPNGEPILLVVEGAQERLDPGSWQTDLRLSAARLTVAGASWAEHGTLDAGRRWLDAPPGTRWADADTLLPAA